MTPALSKLSAAALVVTSIVSPAQAFWRMPCRSRTMLGRVDPLMDYGEPGSHSHAVHGAGSFSFTTNYTDIHDAPCTSCGVKEDTSVYWTPSLHFEHPDGTTDVVEQVGGMLAYYLLYSNPGEKIQAFPDAFAMIAGDTFRRTFPYPIPDPPKSDWGPADETQKALEAKALGFNCLNYATTPEPSLYRHEMPSKEFMDANCLDGIRLELMFPSCWDGKNAFTPDGKSHMKYPNLVNTGVCPENFDTRVPSLFFETIWNTYAFKGKPGRFVLSNGDLTGNGYHGDFMMGWNADFLQQAVDTCTNLSGEIQDCPLFTLQSDDQMAQCSVPLPAEVAHDDCAGPRKGLCGDNPIGGKPVLPSSTSDVPSPKNTHATPVFSIPTATSVPSATLAQAGPNIGTTPAPAPKASSLHVAPVDAPNVVSTKTYTSQGVVYEEAIVEVDVVVTDTVTATPTIAARHLHRHNHAMFHHKGNF